MDQTITTKRLQEENILSAVLVMAQQSLDPEAYEGFVTAYNQIIENRRLAIDKV